MRLADEVRHELEQRYREPNRRLEAMLGPAFPMWDTE
jgi:hypothetical protein